MHQGLTLEPVEAPPACRTLLRDVQAEDFPQLAAMRRNHDLQSQLLTVPEALDDEAIKGWIARRVAEPSGGFRVVADAVSGGFLGFVQVSHVHRRNRVGQGGIALAPSARGQGYGHDMLGLLIAYATHELGLVKLMAEIRADNAASLRVHHAAGYRTVGLMDAHFRGPDGVHDVVLLERHLDGARR